MIKIDFNTPYYDYDVTLLQVESKKDINYPQFTDTNFDKEMNKIFRWVKAHKDNK